MIIFFSITAATLVMIASMSGVLFTSRYIFGWINTRLTYLATFSAGVLSVLTFRLIEESFHESSSFFVAGFTIFCGFAALEIIHRVIPNEHHHHETTDHTHSSVDGRRVLLTDGVHNITDGFLIVSSFVADWRIGVGATVGILVHEVVQEISEFFVLRHAGYSNARALFFNFLSSSTILVGVAAAFFLTQSGNLLAVLIGISAGGFFSVVTRDLLPSAMHSAIRSGTWVQHGTLYILGCVLMMYISLIAPHAEDSDATHADERISTPSSVAHVRAAS
jgi:zinc and cadmium transporter